MALMSTYEIKNKLRVLVSFIIGVVYASSDEIHQLFVPGREGAVRDVLIDSTGVITGICIVIIILKIIKGIKSSKK